jgi:CheY-like chemotaxis protein
VTSEGRNQGSTFTVLLSTVRIDALARGPKVDFKQAGGLAPCGLRILLVEDNADTGLLLKKILQRRGHQVHLATSLQMAKLHADKHEFDLVISDVGLPDGSGLELMQHIRETRPTPGIAMSGFGMEDDIRRSREAGFSEHLTKPVSIAKLEEAIASLSEQLAKAS